MNIQVGKPTEMETRLVAVWDTERAGGRLLIRTVSFWGDENLLELDRGRV